MSIDRAEIEKRINEHLRDKKVGRISIAKNGVMIEFTDGPTFIAALECGPGLDSEWYRWLRIKVPGAGEIDFD